MNTNIEAREEIEGRKKLGELAGHLLAVQIKADRLQPAMVGESNLPEQQVMLAEHLARTTKLLQKAGEGSRVDANLLRAIEVAIDAGGFAADLMYLDRLGGAGRVRRVTRSDANRGLYFAWDVMKKLKDDPLWAARNKSEADDWLSQAQSYRDKITNTLPTTAGLTAGVTAAQIVDFVVTGPQLLASGKAALASGKAALKSLAEWLSQGGGGPGTLRVGSGGALVLVSGGRTLVLTGVQGVQVLEALVQAGRLSANALVLYNLAKGGSEVGALGPGGGGGDPLENLSIHGNVEKWQDKERWLNIAEPLTVGEEGVPESVARARALDVDNRELLGMATNQRTQARGVPMRQLAPPRTPISVTQDPSALVSRRFSEIEEMRDIFNEAVASIKNPNSLTPTALKNRINGKVWEIIKAGKSPQATRVRAALEKIGAENVSGKGYRLRLSPSESYPKPSTVHPRTGTPARRRPWWNPFWPGQPFGTSPLRPWKPFVTPPSRPWRPFVAPPPRPLWERFGTSPTRPSWERFGTSPTRPSWERFGTSPSRSWEPFGIRHPVSPNPPTRLGPPPGGYNPRPLWQAPHFSPLPRQWVCGGAFGGGQSSGGGQSNPRSRPGSVVVYPGALVS